MNETLLGKTLHALIFLGICAGIIALGWHEPLRYRFLSRTEIVELEGAAEPPREAWQSTSKLTGTALDRSPYDIKQGKIEYSKKHDPRKIGAPTESERRANTIGKQ